MGESLCEFESGVKILVVLRIIKQFVSNIFTHRAMDRTLAMKITMIKMTRKSKKSKCGEECLQIVGHTWNEGDTRLLGKLSEKKTG